MPVTGFKDQPRQTLVPRVCFDRRQDLTTDAATLHFGSRVHALHFADAVSMAAERRRIATARPSRRAMKTVVSGAAISSAVMW